MDPKQPKDYPPLLQEIDDDIERTTRQVVLLSAAVVGLLACGLVLLAVALL